MALDAYLILKHGGKLVAEGETYDKVYSPQGAMQLLSFSLSSQVDPSEEPTAEETEKATPYFKLKVTKEIDNASPDLFLAHCKQAYEKKLTYDEAKLVLRKSAGKKPIEYLTMEMKRVVVESYKLENSDGDELPEEEFTLTFRSLRMVYFPQSDTGKAGAQQPGGWDFGEKCSIA